MLVLKPTVNDELKQKKHNDGKKSTKKKEDLNDLKSGFNKPTY
jgi:hypothetical protein